MPNYTKEQRTKLNEDRLLKVYHTMRPKFLAIIKDLEGKGWEPIIDAQVHRTPAQQAELKRKGNSSVSYSYHTVTGRNGEPESLAIDLTDARYGWDSPPDYWLQLASSAESHGCETGIRWGLKTPQRLIINTLIKLKKWKGSYARGWDAAHVQPKGISLGQARAGKRP